MTITLDAKVPAGPLADKWDNHKFDLKLVAPNNRRRFDIIVVGTGLAGASAAASLGEMGYNVKVFTYHDSPRRAHSIAAQGGINAAKNYRNDGDSVHRLFYDTIKGGDYRSREGNVYRLAAGVGRHHRPVRRAGRARSPASTAACSTTARSVAPRCRARSTPGARPASSCCSARTRRWRGRSTSAPSSCTTAWTCSTSSSTTTARRAASSPATCSPARRRAHNGHAVVLATGGYGNVYFLSTNAKACNVTATWRAHRKGAAFANPCYTQIHPTCIPASDEFQSKLTLMSESLRNDGRIWVPKNIDDCAKNAGDDRRVRPRLLPRAEVPELRQPRAPRRRVPQRQDDGRLGPRRRPAPATACTSTSRDSIAPPRRGHRARALREPLRHVRAHHGREPLPGADAHLPRHPLHDGRAVGGLQPACPTIPGLFVLGEANFSDHGANRLGASALMQGLADGYFVIPATIAGYLAGQLGTKPAPVDHAVFDTAENEVNDRVEAAHVGQGHAVGRPLPPRARQDRVGLLRHGAQQGRPREGAVGDPRAPRAVLEGRQGPRRRRTATTSRSRRRSASPTSWRWPS